MVKIFLSLLISVFLYSQYEISPFPYGINQESQSVPNYLANINSNYDALYYMYDLSSSSKPSFYIKNLNDGKIIKVMDESVANINLNDNKVVYGDTSTNVPFTWTESNGFTDFRTKCSPTCNSGIIVNVAKDGSVYGALDFADDAIEKLIPFTYKNNILTKLELPINNVSAAVGFEDTDGNLYGTFIDTKNTNNIFSIKNGVISILDNSISYSQNNKIMPRTVPNKKVNNLLQMSNVVYDMNDSIITQKGYNLSDNGEYLSNKKLTSLDCLFPYNKNLGENFVLTNNNEIIKFNHPTTTFYRINSNSTITNNNYCTTNKLSVVSGGKLNLKRNEIQTKKNKRLKLAYKILNSKGKPVSNAIVYFYFSEIGYMKKTNSKGIATFEFTASKNRPYIWTNYTHPLYKNSIYNTGIESTEFAIVFK